MAALPPARSHPTVLLGDLNMGPRPAGRLTGMTPLASGPTFPAVAPRTQIDHILTSGTLSPARGHVMELPISDHRALVTDL
jgi:endonuclease/exonuclease/phosphatase family metal-dependent hydrolase